jgi:hypothetical protein
MGTVEVIQVIGILLGILVTMGSIFVAYGKLSERHDSSVTLAEERHTTNVEAIRNLDKRFEEHTERENRWQEDQAKRLTRVEAVVEKIDEHLKNGYRLKRRTR